MATTERIVLQILADAEAAVAEIKRSAEEQGAAIVTAAKEWAVADAAAQEKAMEQQAESEKRRILIAAELTVRRETLARKQALLGEVFDTALERLYQLPEGVWEALIEKLVLQYAETGKERVRFAAADQTRGRALLPRLNKSLKAKGLPGELTLDDEAGTFKGGIALIGTKTEINASFEAMFRNLRGASEAEVAALLL